MRRERARALFAPSNPEFIDHSTLSFDADAELIEDDFLGGQGLNPAPMAVPIPALTHENPRPSSATYWPPSTSTNSGCPR
jgi:hypothetical protein